MKCVSAIAHGISALEKAHLDGYLVNQSMAAFIFCKALLKKLPAAQVIYDGRTYRDSEARPNLYIWRDGATPLVHFIGNLRYETHDVTGDRKQIQSLKDYAAMPSIPLLTRDPASLQYIERPMETAPNPDLGLFIAGERKVKFRHWSARGEQYSE
jgi:hypothetical protein